MPFLPFFWALMFLFFSDAWKLLEPEFELFDEDEETTRDTD